MDTRALIDEISCALGAALQRHDYRTAVRLAHRLELLCEIAIRSPSSRPSAGQERAC